MEEERKEEGGGSPFESSLDVLINIFSMKENEWGGGEGGGCDFLTLCLNISGGST